MQVRVKNLKVPNSKPVALKLTFVNNQRNVQLQVKKRSIAYEV